MCGHLQPDLKKLRQLHYTTDRHYKTPVVTGKAACPIVVPSPMTLSAAASCRYSGTSRWWRRTER